MLRNPFGSIDIERVLADLRQEKAFNSYFYRPGGPLGHLAQPDGLSLAVHICELNLSRTVLSIY